MNKHGTAAATTESAQKARICARLALYDESDQARIKALANAMGAAMPQILADACDVTSAVSDYLRG